MLHIRALIKSDAVLLFDTYGSVNSKLQSSFLYHLEVRRPRASYPPALNNTGSAAQSESQRNGAAV